MKIFVFTVAICFVVSLLTSWRHQSSVMARAYAQTQRYMRRLEVGDHGRRALPGDSERALVLVGRWQQLDRQLEALR